jgi:HD superfamily phosphohydrolase
MSESVFAALGEGYTEPVRDALWGHIYFTPELVALLESPAFNRLFRIFQLGPAYFAYPGATHTRAAHSIGVYHLARRLARNLAEKGAAGWMTAEGAKSFLCAALLHDLGHFPYTHSLKELPLESHEALTAKLIVSPTSGLRKQISAAGGDPYFTAKIIDSQIPADGNDELIFYRKLLSGVLDPDKLDYLNRDARYCGVPYGAQDVDFILSRLYPDKNRGVDIDSKGIASVESVLFSKYLMYRAVYWHKIVRSATAMVKKALLAGLADGEVRPGELYHLDDQELFKLMESRLYPLFGLAADVKNGRLYGEAAELPWDDAYAPLADVEKRAAYERLLAGALSVAGGRAAGGGELAAADLIIDVPEPVSLETSLYIRDEGRLFSESSSAFAGETVAAFVKSLRVVRIFAAPGCVFPRADFAKCLESVILHS